MRPVCRHCKLKQSLAGKRGLCWACYFNPDIRKHYRCLPSGRPSKLVDCLNDRSDAMTEEQLDAMIEEQRPTMPGGLNLDGPKSKVGKAGLYRRLS